MLSLKFFEFCNTIRSKADLDLWLVKCSKLNPNFI